MAAISMKQLLEAGVHFGHQTRRWNPKMRDFIFGERNGIHIIDLAQTVSRLDAALEFVRETIRRGDSILFVGTKKQAQETVSSEAERCGQHYVNNRWLGGMLTNFTTIKRRIQRLEALEARRDAGEFERLTKKEAGKLTEEITKLNGALGGHSPHATPARGDLRRRPAPRVDRRARGPPPRDPDRCDHRYQLRPGPDRLGDPRQR